ncbi:MAG: hypothetical protein WKF37_21085 [Bryobacteraceae bacterium]
MEANTAHGDLKEALTELTPPPAGDPPVGTSVVLSLNPASRHWSHARYAGAAQALFMTFAFGMNKLFKKSMKRRFRITALMDSRPTWAAKVRAAERPHGEYPQNECEPDCGGNRIASNQFDHWARETLTGLNTHVQFITRNSCWLTR